MILNAALFIDGLKKKCQILKPTCAKDTGENPLSTRLGSW